MIYYWRILFAFEFHLLDELIKIISVEFHLLDELMKFISVEFHLLDELMKFISVEFYLPDELINWFRPKNNDWQEGYNCVVLIGLV
jgi:hypothetical protein